jgi:hypothetical protein
VKAEMETEGAEVKLKIREAATKAA